MNQSILKLDQNILNKVKSSIPENTSPFEQGGDEEQYRFISFVCDFFSKRKSLGLMPSSGASYFVFIPPEYVRDVENLGVGISSLRKNKGYELSGKIFLCLDSSLNKTRVISFSGNDDDIRNNLEEKLQEIISFCGVNLFHSVVDFKVETISVYFSEYGASVNDEYELIIHYGNERQRFSHEKINQFSDDFHERETKLPTCGMMIWSNQKGFKLTEKAEDKIALRFALTLSTILGKDYVSQETRGAHGRADVTIHTEAMIEGQGPCILEFKVLRQNEAYNSENWLKSGIIQVLDYGKDRNAKSHYLMVYDGRKELGRLKSIEKESEEKNVIYLHFEMYNTVDGERKSKL
jgi:hypothetical protein